MRIDIRDSKYSIIYNEKTGTVEDVLWCNESAEDLKNLNVVADMARELAVYRQAGTAMIAGAQRLAYSRGPEKYSFSVPSEKHRHLHTVDRTDAARVQGQDCRRQPVPRHDWLLRCAAMMHLKITDEIRERCLREAAHDAHINDRIVTSTPQTLAERGMTMLGSTRATPRIRSYLYCDAVDACFYYAGAVPSVVVTARWTADSPDIAEGSKKPQIAAEVVRRMMTAMDKAMKAEKDRQWAAYMEEQKLK